jgi:hypothetical protein
MQGVTMRLVLCVLFFCVILMGQEKDNVVVVDLSNRGGLEVNEIRLISDRINAVLFNSGKFTLVEREQIDQILKEQGFQQSGACSDQQCLVEVGKILAVHRIVGGSIGKVNKMYAVTLKIIDVQTGAIVASVSHDATVSSESLLKNDIPNLTGTLLQKAGYAQQEQKTVRNKKVPWIIAAGGLVAVGVVGTAVYYVRGKNTSDTGPTGSSDDVMSLPPYPTRSVGFDMGGLSK